MRGRGRFLEFPIQSGRAEIVRPRGTPLANAATPNEVGGYMKGEKMRGRKGGEGRPGVVPCKMVAFGVRISP